MDFSVRLLQCGQRTAPCVWEGFLGGYYLH